MTTDLDELIAAAVIIADKAVNDADARIAAVDAAQKSSDAAYDAAHNMNDDTVEAAYAAANIAYAAYIAMKGN
jgi:hypothetical protein